MSNPMRHDQQLTHPITYIMTDPQMKTKTVNTTMNKTRVQNCDVRAVSHSCVVFFSQRPLLCSECDIWGVQQYNIHKCGRFSSPATSLGNIYNLRPPFYV